MAVRTMVVRAVRSRGSGALSRARRWHGPTSRVRATGNCRVHRENAAAEQVCTHLQAADVDEQRHPTPVLLELLHRVVDERASRVAVGATRPLRRSHLAAEERRSRGERDERQLMYFHMLSLIHI